jgi:hypothetical protein
MLIVGLTEPVSIIDIVALDTPVRRINSRWDNFLEIRSARRRFPISSSDVCSDI